MYSAVLVDVEHAHRINELQLDLQVRIEADVYWIYCVLKYRYSYVTFVIMNMIDHNDFFIWGNSSKCSGANIVGGI